MDQQMNLAERALKVKYDVSRLMGSPKAALIPADARRLITEMAEIMADMAVVIVVKG